MTRPRTPLLAVVLTALLAFPAGIVLASHQFDDVPASSSIHDDVEAIADAGITTGCGGGDYCPSDPVTRGQMAQFMNRLGALDGQAPSVNARTLGGYPAHALVRVSSSSTDEMSAPLTASALAYLEVQIIAPTNGYVHVTAAATARTVACTVNCVAEAWLRRAGGDVLTIVFPTQQWITERGSLALTDVYEVTAGAHTFEVVLARPTAGDGNMNGWNAHMSAVFIPFDGTGAPPD